MKAKLNAGADLNILDKDELRGELERFRVNWQTEVTRGITWRRSSATATADAAGLVTVSFKPAAGFSWKLRRVTVPSGYDPSTQAVGLYVGSVGNSGCVVPKLLTAATTGLDEIVRAGDEVLVAGTVTAGATVWVTYAAWEAPNALTWKLL